MLMSGSKASAGRYSGAGGVTLTRLATTVERSRELGGMLINPHALLVVSSVAQHNLEKKLKKDLLPGLLALVPSEEMRLIHVSGNKI